jgi:hypothetical protein
MTKRVVASVPESSIVWGSQSITKMLYNLTARNNVIKSWDLSDTPENNIRKKNLEQVRAWARNYTTINMDKR